MPLVSQSINALYGGVSQQAAVQRNPTQLESAVNCSFGLAEGASKRPPLETVTQLTASTLVDPAIGWIPVTSGETFVVVVPGDGSYEVFRASDGAKLTTENADTGLAYLTCTGKPSDVFRFTFIDNQLYIVNREFTATMTAAETSGALNGTAQTLQDPKLDGTASGIWKILGAEANPFDTYYVNKQGDYWVEWVAPGIQYQIDSNTMPHTFDILEDGVDPLGYVAQFNTVAWVDRRVGDNDSNKVPSFIGDRINAVTLAADRLVLMSRQAISMSRVDDHLDFWRSSVTDVLDDDRIDIEVVATETTDLAWMTAGGDFTRLREMFIQEDTITLDASDASAHVFKYLPKMTDMAGHSSFDHILMVPEDKTSAMYSYQYQWSGNEKTMSAWGKWRLSTEVSVLSLKEIDQYIYAVYQLEEGPQATYLGRFNLEPGYSAAGFPHGIHLDHLQLLNGSYNSTEDRTYFVSNFPVNLETPVNPRETIVTYDGTVQLAPSSLGWQTNPSDEDYRIRPRFYQTVPDALTVGDTATFIHDDGRTWSGPIDFIAEDRTYIHCSVRDSPARNPGS